MTAAFITLTFEWFWLVIAWVLAGGPLLAILMSWRAMTDAGRARYAAIGALLGAATAALGIWLFLDQGDWYPNLSIVLMVAGMCLGLPAWLASAVTTCRGRIWADLVVIALPTALGAWAWYIE